MRVPGFHGFAIRYGAAMTAWSSHSRFPPPVTAAEHAKGAPDAALVLEEFGDFECGYCKRAFPILGMLLAGNEASIRLVYRHFPALETHPHALMAAEASEAAAAQGKFWEFHDLLFSRAGELNARLLVDFAQRLGLDLPRFNSDLETHAHQPRVLQDLEAGRTRGVRGTPGFYFNGKFVDTSYGLHHLRDAVRDGLARVKGSPAPQAGPARASGSEPGR